MTASPNTSLLLDEYPLILMPTLACAVGLNRAIFLQQVHYWCRHYRREHDLRHYHAGRWWVYNAVHSTKPGPDWLQNFPFWSPSTIKRIISSIVSDHLVIQGNYNLAGYDRTGWYTIDYDQLTTHLDQWRKKQAAKPHRPRRSGQSDLMDQLTLTQSIGSDRPNGSGQLDPMDWVKLTPTIPETTHRIPEEDTEINRLWQQCTNEIALQMTRETYSQWIAPSHLVHIDPEHSTATILCNDIYVLDWCRNKLDVIISRTLSGILGTPTTITYKLKEAAIVPST